MADTTEDDGGPVFPDPMRGAADAMLKERSK
jgi:hypothetical protein